MFRAREVDMVTVVPVLATVYAETAAQETREAHNTVTVKVWNCVPISKARGDSIAEANSRGGEDICGGRP